MEHDLEVQIFKFNDENLERAKTVIAKYPELYSSGAVMGLLYIAQEQCGGWIPKPAILHIADMLGMPYIKVQEVATFYTMYNLSPVGKYLIQICRTTSCWVCKSDEILETCKKVLQIDVGETTDDGLFTLCEVECLGACVDAPVVQINNDYHERLTPEKMEQIITQLRANG